MTLTWDRVDARVREFLCSGKPILAGVSGGRDSMALLALLAREEQCRVIVCHVNHGIRSEAAEDERFVEEYARQCGLPFLSAKADVPERARREHVSIEQAARCARQECFAAWAEQYSGAMVALAHHRNDQQETALMHLCRGGSGVQGMDCVSAWPGCGGRRLVVLRPLLDFSRQEITRFLCENNIDWVEDASNGSCDYARNFIRHKVVPLLDEVFCRDTSVTIARACLAGGQVKRAMVQALECMDLIDPQGRLYLPKVTVMPNELKQCTLHWYLRQCDVPELSYAVVRRVAEILEPTCAARVSLPGGLIAMRKEKRLSVVVQPNGEGVNKPVQCRPGKVGER